MERRVEPAADYRVNVPVIFADWSQKETQKKRPPRGNGEGVFERSGLFACFGSLFRNRRCWLADVGYDDVSSVRGADASWELEIADVQGAADFQIADVHLDGFRKIVWKADDFERVDVLFHEATCFDTSGFTVEVSRDVSGDFGLIVDSAEVSVQGDAGKWVVLDGLKECEACAFTFDVQVDEDIFGAAVGQKFGERLSVHLEVLTFHAASVDYGREPAFTAHLLESSGTATCARCCFK